MEEQSEARGVEQEGNPGNTRESDDSEDEFENIPYQPLVDTDDEEAAQDFGYSLIGHSNSGSQLFSSDDEVEIEVGYMHFGGEKEEDVGEEKEMGVAALEDELKEKFDESSQELNVEEIERRITELELQTNEGPPVETTATANVPLPKKKGFSLESPFPSSIDADQADLLKKQALQSFDSKYQQEVSRGASTEKREEQFPELSKEYVDDIKAVMQGIKLSLPPMDVGQDKQWQELLNKRKKKGN